MIAAVKKVEVRTLFDLVDSYYQTHRRFLYAPRNVLDKI